MRNLRKVWIISVDLICIGFLLLSFIPSLGDTQVPGRKMT